VSLLVTNKRNDNDFGWLAIALALILGVAIARSTHIARASAHPFIHGHAGVWFSLLGVSYMLYGAIRCRSAIWRCAR